MAPSGTAGQITQFATVIPLGNVSTGAFSPCSHPLRVGMSCSDNVPRD